MVEGARLEIVWAVFVSEVRILSLPPVFKSGLGAVVARTPGGREVASSILVAPTILL